LSDSILGSFKIDANDEPLWRFASR
jgi:hypothetical protein